jgi:single-stranded-DNA-specific exonuclease
MMNGMEEACHRLNRARKNGESVMVHGDYDVDGITSTAMLMRFFESLDIKCTPYIPQRLKEGYGFSHSAIADALKHDITLIVTADCGIAAIEEVEEAGRNGIDVIVTDHHQAGDHLPSAFSILNPKQKDCSYPDKNLSGVGVAWKLCQAFYQFLGNEGDDPEEYLDLVCLGSIADVVPVQGENRAIVRQGLKRISEGTRVGIKALQKISTIRSEQLTYRDVAFLLAPRINAAGRLGEAKRAFQLLYTDDEEEAFHYARLLEEENQRRRRIESEVSEEIRDILSRSFDSRNDFAIVMYSADWHPGVIGIVASRFVEEFYRPIILISVSDDGIGRGSARSIPELPIYDTLSKCSEHLEQFGGHSYAAGLKVKESNIEVFREEFQRVAKEELEGVDLIPDLSIDLEIDIETVTSKLVEELKEMEPFGPGNPSPLFCLRDVSVADNPRVLSRNTLKFSINHDGLMFDVVGFGKGEYLERIRKGSRIDIAVHLEEDRWRGKKNIGMKLEDIRLKGAESG